MLRPCALVLLVISLAAADASAQIRVNPTGVNVNSQGATTVFLTFGGLADQIPAEAFWCGELIPAAPDIGLKCDPSTIFGSLPIRFDQSRTSGTSGFTDIMSIPPSVARRAYQAAEAGQRSSFFYVRRFVSRTGGPDEYVAVTCRMAGGGARVPLSLVNVEMKFAVDVPALFVRTGQSLPSFKADITYNGTGRLKGRWEIVQPGDELPTPDDLLTEATLPIERRGSQRRYLQLDRFNVFLPPVGRLMLPGPDVRKLPTAVEGTYYVLLRVEASDDKEGDSSLAAVGAGPGIVHSGAVAGFPMPVLRYIVGAAESSPAVAGGLELLLPSANASVNTRTPLDFTWAEVNGGEVYRVELQNAQQQLVHAALVRPGIGTYRAPSWLSDKAADGALRWRVVAIGIDGDLVRTSPWRTVRFAR
jgi:hypothetical protein